jgi:choline dehydrogenase-like flavoprotein
MRMFNSNIVPESLKRLITDAMILRNPDRVVREYVDRGLPHKLNGLFIDAITEQSPNPESRITLSDRKDVLGTPMARVDWRISYSERHSLMRIGQLLEKELRRAGLPVPILERWILDERPEDSIVIDMAHTLGTTRMSQDPKLGVVNPDCQVHGVRGLFIAGGSVFPTGGHVNPTLMILALAIRLGDHIKIRLAT